MNRRHILIGTGGALLAGVLGWRASVGSMAAYDRCAARLRAPLPNDPGVADLIRYATLAANSHNTQPWRFHPGAGVIDILPDPARATPIVDPDDHHLFVSLGCAVENLAIAAGATGRQGEVLVGPDSVRYAFTQGTARPDPLLSAIPLRQSTRAEYDGRPLPSAMIERLRQAAELPGVHAAFITDQFQMRRLRDLIVAGNTAQMTDPAFRAELKHWLRFNPRQAMATGDGLFSVATGNPALPGFLGGLAFEHFVTAAAENDKCARQIASSSGIVILTAAREDPAHWMVVGRACQRFALTATLLGLKHAFVNQPAEVARLRPELAALIGEEGKRPDLVIRFGYGPTLPFSLRRESVG